MTLHTALPMRMQQWKRTRAAIALTLTPIGMCNEVIRLLYEMVDEKVLSSVNLAKPTLCVLSPPECIFPSIQFRTEYIHKWFDGQNHRFLGGIKLKNSGYRWRKALVSTTAAIYSKSNNSSVGSTYYILIGRDVL